jgi:4-hydroxy-3-methylbut-2-enyl diphosphate reductase
VLVQGVVDALSARFDLTVQELGPTRETVTFKLPRVLVE